MIQLEFTFLALSHSIEIIFGVQTTFEKFSNDFMLLFVDEKDKDSSQISINALQENNPQFRNKIEEFITDYKDVNIKVFQLRGYFQKLLENEQFFVIPSVNITIEQSTHLFNYLTSLRDGKDFEAITQEHDTLFGELTKTYFMKGFDVNTKKTIGKQDKSKRVCRFCDNKRENVTFKNIAHAISESLGNKKIILNEECDECNSEFGSASGIEASLITFLKFYGNFFGVKGKNGVAKIKGKNFELSNDGEIVLNYYASNDDELNENDENPAEAKFRLETHDKIIMQDIYKTLCKYFLSVIDSSFLPQFKDTIEWINGKKTLSELPKVAILSSYNFFKIHPSLMTYIKKNNEEKLPYAIGEFHYTYLTIVFIIPLTKNDKVNFTKDDDYNIFWNHFKHYSGVPNWKYRDFSNSIRQNFIINLNLNQKKDDESTNPDTR